MSNTEERSKDAHHTKRVADANLKGMSAAQLQELIVQAQAELVTKQESAKSDLRAKWQAEAAASGLTLDAVTSIGPGKGKNRSHNSGSVVPKYRGPNGEEWSGRGRLPKWVQKIEAEGGSRDQFRI